MLMYFFTCIKKYQKSTRFNDASMLSIKNKKICKSSPDCIGKRKRLLPFSIVFYIHATADPPLKHAHAKKQKYNSDFWTFLTDILNFLIIFTLHFLDAAIAMQATKGWPCGILELPELAVLRSKNCIGWKCLFLILFWTSKKEWKNLIKEKE